LEYDGMSPQAALGSNIFRCYTGLVIGIAVLSWVSITLLRRFTGRDVSHAAQSFRGWLIMAPAALAAIFLGRIAAIGFVFVLAIFGFLEYARATGLARDRVFMAVVCTSIVVLGIDVALAGKLQPYLNWYEAFLAFPFLATAVIVCVPVVRNRTEGELRQMMLAVFGFLYIGWMFGHLALLANDANAYGYLMYLFFAVELNDIAAYLCGRFLGRRPLRSNISPKKTWEGALGGLLVSLVLAWLLRFSFPHFGTVAILVIGLIVGIGGQLGDLVISVIKREAHLKDMGAILPGHGGILDRIDSLIFVAPLFTHVVRALDRLLLT
jgi:phosphatidate cytidylyltransferase